jgi:hypothetical protein
MEKIRILFLSANPWTTSRIRVDEEAREIFERIQEGPNRDKIELYKHAAIRPIDLQRLLLTYEPHIVHFSGHASKTQKLILGGTPGRGKEVDRQGLVEMFGLYKNHVRLVVLNACFTRAQALSLATEIDYSVGTDNSIGDKAGVAFAGAFYRALGFGKSIKEAFESAKAELGLTKMRRAQGIELFTRNGVDEKDPFPLTDIRTANPGSEPSGGSSTLCADELSDQKIPWSRIRGNLVLEGTEERFESHITIFEASTISRSSKLIRTETVIYVSGRSRLDVSDNHPGDVGSAGADAERIPGRSEEFLASKTGRES